MCGETLRHIYTGTDSVGLALRCQRRRATLLPCGIKCNRHVSVCGHFDRGLMDRIYKKPRHGMELCIVVSNQGGRSGIKGALRWSSKNRVTTVGSARLLHLQVAVMRSIATAAGREIRVWIRGEREQRRDQREAEEQEQRDCQEAAHTAIVADEYTDVILTLLTV
jgi:hypothetical protein